MIGTGLSALTQVFRHDRGDAAEAADQGLGRLLISALALSIGNLAAGFALGTYHVALLTAAVLIGAVSVAVALIGLELGRLAGSRIGGRGEALGGIVLAGAGIAIAAGSRAGRTPSPAAVHGLPGHPRPRGLRAVRPVPEERSRNLGEEGQHQTQRTPRMRHARQGAAQE